MVDWLKRKVKREVKSEVRDQTRTVERKVERKVKDEASARAKKAIKYRASKKITGKMIKSFAKFKESWEKVADDPVQSVFHFLIAAYNYNKDRDKGTAMATTVLSKKHHIKDSSSPSGYRLGKTDGYLMEHMREHPYTVKAYLGGTYKKDYKDFDEKKPVMFFLAKKQTDKKGKYTDVVIQSGGKDFPTPVGLAKNKEGQWKVTEFSSIATDCREPKSAEDDF